jgi:hypothetical protein
MTARHMARDRVAAFVRVWRRAGWSAPISSFNGAELLIADLEALTRPRQVVRTLAQLQALAPGTVLKVQGDRAAQVEAYEDVDDEGELLEVKKMIYVGTDLDDYLTERYGPDLATRDTLRRMLPAIVIDPLD